MHYNAVLLGLLATCVLGGTAEAGPLLNTLRVDHKEPKPAPTELVRQKRTGALVGNILKFVGDSIGGVGHLLRGHETTNWVYVPTGTMNVPVGYYPGYGQGYGPGGFNPSFGYGQGFGPGQQWYGPNYNPGYGPGYSPVYGQAYPPGYHPGYGPGYGSQQGWPGFSSGGSSGHHYNAITPAPSFNANNIITTAGDTCSYQDPQLCP